MLKVIRTIKDGQILLTASEAVKLGSGLVEEENSKLDQVTQIQTAIEAKGIRSVAHNGKDPLYISTDLAVSGEDIENGGKKKKKQG